MKNIFLIIGFLICSIISFGQNGNWSGITPLPGNPNTISQSSGALRGTLGVIAGSFADTSAANANLKTNTVSGTQIWVTSTKSYWFWNGNHWVEISPVSAICELSMDGSAVWSGSGLVYNVMALTYNFPQSTCVYYHTTATQVTLSAADPVNIRYDVIYADIDQVVSVLPGTAGSGIPPAVNPFTQRIVAIVTIPAGSLVPGGGTASTIVYNENVEWTGSSTVSGADFNYATNPYIGSKSAYFPTPSNGTTVTWQNGSQLNIGNYGFFPFYLRLDAAVSGSPAALLTVSFYVGTTQVTSPITVGNGQYGCNYSTINAWQPITIPISAPFNGTPFDRVKITFNGAPTLQIDYAYLLQNNPVPPLPTNQWNVTGLNDVSALPNAGIGTSSLNDFKVYAGNLFVGSFPSGGFQFVDGDTTYTPVVQNPSTLKFQKVHFPTIQANFPLVINTVTFKDHIYADTTLATATALVTHNQLTNAVAAVVAWKPTGNSGLTVSNFLGNTDDVGLKFKVNNVQSGYIDRVNGNTAFGYRALVGNSAGGAFAGLNTAIGINALAATTGSFNNVAVGDDALAANTDGGQNTAVGSSAMALNTTGIENTAIGTGALVQNTAGSFNLAIGAYVLNGSQGNNNVGIGTEALQGMTVGAANTVIGNQAGKYLANGVTVLTRMDSSIFIGNQTKSSVNAQHNQIVIGSQATSLGSNTTVIGNSATTITRLYGNLGLGIDAPTAYLHLAAGTTSANTAPIKFTSGNPTTTPVAGQMMYKTGLWIIDSSASVRDTIATRSFVRASSGGGGSPWTQGSGVIYPTTLSDLVGIGTSTPLVKLDVDGQINTSSRMYVQNGYNGDTHFSFDALTGEATMGDPVGAFNNIKYVLSQSTGHNFTGNLTATKLIAPNVISSTVQKNDEDWTAVVGTYYRYEASGTSQSVTFSSGNDADLIQISVGDLNGGTLNVVGADVKDQNANSVGTLPEKKLYTLRWETANAWYRLSVQN